MSLGILPWYGLTYSVFDKSLISSGSLRILYNYYYYYFATLTVFLRQSAGFQRWKKNHHVSRYLSFDIICIFVGAEATLFSSPFCLCVCVCVWRPTFQSRWRWPTNELSAACSKKQDLFRVFALPRLPLLTS